MDLETIKAVLEQWPMFAIIVWIWFAFYKFMDRVYVDHTRQMEALQETFKQSLSQVTDKLWQRLDKIEDTLIEIKSKR